MMGKRLRLGFFFRKTDDFREEKQFGNKKRKIKIKKTCLQENCILYALFGCSLLIYRAKPGKQPLRR